MVRIVYKQGKIIIKYKNDMFARYMERGSVEFEYEDIFLRTLKPFLCKDEFGYYKKTDTKIPLLLKWYYNELKSSRELNIFKKYYNLDTKCLTRLNGLVYYFSDIDIPTESDKLEALKLLGMG